MAINRQQVFIKCLDKVNKQIEKYNNNLASIRESTDSIDRHNDYDEEGKMIGEFEKNSNYLDNAQRMKETLRSIDMDHYTEQVQFGSIVETKKNYYFIAAAVGEITMDDGSRVYAISKEAPLFEKLQGKKAGDTFQINDEEVEIVEVH